MQYYILCLLRLFHKIVNSLIISPICPADLQVLTASLCCELSLWSDNFCHKDNVISMICHKQRYNVVKVIHFWAHFFLKPCVSTFWHSMQPDFLFACSWPFKTLSEITYSLQSHHLGQLLTFAVHHTKHWCQSSLIQFHTLFLHKVSAF